MEQKFPKAYRHDDGKTSGGTNIKPVNVIKKPKAKKRSSVLLHWFSSESRKEQKNVKLSVSSKERDNICPVEKGEKAYLAGLGYCQRAQYPEALNCFKEAAGQQYPAAYLWLGCLYENDGLVGPKNPEESMKWYNKAKDEMSWFEMKAESTQVDAQFNLGWCYHFGVGVAKDVKEAVRYYQLAAAQGYAPAQNSLAWCYEHAEGMDKNTDKALHYYRLAANQGYASAQHNLGWFYQYGGGKDMNKALLYYQLAASQGYASAQNNLAWCYQNGEGVEKDVEKAMYYYQLAADQGHARAQYYLGRCYKKGEGTHKDIDKALHYYRLAANQGDIRAQYSLDRWKSIEENFKEPVPYYSRAVAKKADLYTSKSSTHYSPRFFSLHSSRGKSPDQLPIQNVMAHDSPNGAQTAFKIG